jgi:hypothetical protein
MSCPTRAATTPNPPWRDAPGRSPIVVSEPAQRSSSREGHKEQKDHAAPAVCSPSVPAGLRRIAHCRPESITCIIWEPRAEQSRARHSKSGLSPTTAAASIVYALRRQPDAATSHRAIDRPDLCRSMPTASEQNSDHILPPLSSPHRPRFERRADWRPNRSQSDVCFKEHWHGPYDKAVFAQSLPNTLLCRIDKNCPAWRNLLTQKPTLRKCFEIS